MIQVMDSYNELCGAEERRVVAWRKKQVCVTQPGKRERKTPSIQRRRRMRQKRNGAISQTSQDIPGESAYAVVSDPSLIGIDRDKISPFTVILWTTTRYAADGCLSRTGCFLSKRNFRYLHK